MSFSLTCLPPTASYCLEGSETHSICELWPSIATSRWLPVKWRHFRVTSGHLRSCDVISCHVTAFYCVLQRWREWNVQYMQVFGRLQPLQGDFRSNDVTSGSLQVTWGHVTSFTVTCLPPTASYCLVWSETYSIREFWPPTATSRWLPLKWVTSGHLWPCDVFSCLVTASYCVLQPCRKWNAQYTQILGLLQPLPGDYRSNGSPPGNCGHLKPRDVIFCHVTASYCELQRCRKWNA